MKLCNPSLSPANVLAHPCCNDDDDDHEDNDDDLDVDDDNDCQCTCNPPLLQYSLKMLLQLVEHSVKLKPTLDCSIFPAIFSENAAATSRAFCQLKKPIFFFKETLYT